MVLSYGMGLDSTALLLRWITEPASRDFDLADLAVCTAMTGNEFASTGQDVQAVILPLLRREGIRFIQVARSQRKTTTSGDGVVVLDDSTCPQRLHFSGAYTLGEELLAAGTLPQLGGIRACSIHSKGNCLDPVIARITQGQPYRHAIGFEADEHSRAAKDALYNTHVRTGWYPLVDWGWDRARCREFVTALLGRPWEKSACTFCVFTMATESGRAALVKRYGREPQAGANALFLERVAQSLNSRQTLIAGSSAAELVAGAGLTEVQRLFAAMLERATYAVYEVRRITRRTSQSRKPLIARSVTTVARGSRQAMADYLATLPGRREIGRDGIARHILRERSSTPPSLEHFFVEAPAGVENKSRPGFDAWWREATSDALF
ncbi:hypothetical protein MFM001_42220 [Mycobacterium sp. MFM001]|nr:hypothetical protein MFM001_42220 [Mycobacterium sp. MFM001]